MITNQIKQLVCAWWREVVDELSQYTLKNSEFQSGVVTVVVDSSQFPFLKSFFKKMF